MTPREGEGSAFIYFFAPRMELLYKRVIALQRLSGGSMAGRENSAAFLAVLSVTRACVQNIYISSKLLLDSRSPPPHTHRVVPKCSRAVWMALLTAVACCNCLPLFCNRQLASCEGWDSVVPAVCGALVGGLYMMDTMSIQALRLPGVVYRCFSVSYRQQCISSERRREQLQRDKGGGGLCSSAK